MTAENEPFNTLNGATINASVNNTNASIEPRRNMRLGNAPSEIVEIFQYLSYNDKIIFKSQQIDDPELQAAEKIQIASDIYARSRQTFLMRFGSYLQEQHLEAVSRQLEQTESSAELLLMLQDYKNKLKTHKQDVKNRRYAAMLQLIEKGEYFSELEMMKRAPELYQELVGQHLSESEKQERDSYDVRNTTFSGILMHTMQQQELDDVLKQADEKNKEKNAKNNKKVKRAIIRAKSSKKPLKTIFLEDEVPPSYRQQWGNFDNEQLACSTSRQVNVSSTVKSAFQQDIPESQETDELINGTERELLRQEFIGIMYEKFLSGQDVDFDYTNVDDDSQLDDLKQLNQDKEDAYFESSDDEVNNIASQDFDIQTQANEQESEDELEVYMTHLSKHHSLQV